MTAKVAAAQVRLCSCKQVLLIGIANPEPLTPTEEMFSRALMRIIVCLPRRLDEDMVRASGITTTSTR